MIILLDHAYKNLQSYVTKSVESRVSQCFGLESLIVPDLIGGR